MATDNVRYNSTPHGPLAPNFTFLNVFFLKSIIIGANLLNTCLLDDMTLLTKASYIIITTKQVVLISKRLSLRGEKMLSSTTKQLVLLS